MIRSDWVKDNSPNRHSLGHALFITLVYTVVGTTWIVGSDYLAQVIAGDGGSIVLIQRYKGIAYVVLTAAGLFALIRNALRRVGRFQMRLNDTLEESRQLGLYLNTIIEAAPVAIFDLTESAQVRSLWNTAAERLFGYTAGEVIDTRPPIVSDEAWARIAASREAVLRGETVSLIEVELVRSDGTRFPGVVSAAPVRYGDDWLTIVIVSDTTRLHETLARLEETLAEREVLMREIHHRVKNSLQVVSSLLMLERRETAPSTPAALGLERALARIRSIARVHEMLYHGSNLARVELTHYLRSLAADISSSFDPGHRIDLDLALGSLSLHIDRAVPIGLIFHELLVNAYKHAFEADRAGRIGVYVTTTDSTLELRVSDSGTGFPESGTPLETGRGLMLVQALSAQIDATVTMDNKDGATVTLRAPLPADA